MYEVFGVRLIWFLNIAKRLFTVMMLSILEVHYFYALDDSTSCEWKATTPRPLNDNNILVHKTYTRKWSKYTASTSCISFFSTMAVAGTRTVSEFEVRIRGWLQVQYSTAWHFHPKFKPSFLGSLDS